MELKANSSIYTSIEISDERNEGEIKEMKEKWMSSVFLYFFCHTVAGADAS